MGQMVGEGMKYVAIYIRVSTIWQAEEGYSLQAQRKTLEEWAKDRKYDVVCIYEDAGISGKDIAHRPSVQQMLSEADEHKFDIVLVWALSRLTRSVSDLYNIWTRLSKASIDLISYTEPFDTSTISGRAMMGMLGVFAQMERELTSERVKACMAERAAQGKRTCNGVLGYDIDGKDSLNINVAEAEQVRFIFENYIGCKNLSNVARHCTALGYTGKRGKRLSAGSIRTILNCPIYAGYNRFYGKLYKGAHQPIITEELYDEVQRIIWRENKAGRKNTKEICLICECTRLH